LPSRTVGRRERLSAAAGPGLPPSRGADELKKEIVDSLGRKREKTGATGAVATECLTSERTDLGGTGVVKKV